MSSSTNSHLTVLAHARFADPGHCMATSLACGGLLQSARTLAANLKSVVVPAAQEAELRELLIILSQVEDIATHLGADTARAAKHLG